MDNLAKLLRKKLDYAAAEPLLWQALAIDEKAFGSDHPKVAAVLNDLGLVLRDKGDYAAAEPMLRRALAIAEKTLGPDHPETRVIEGNLESLAAKAPRQNLRR
jgi:tetratricopeptide (TPR) repeat protein